MLLSTSSFIWLKHHKNNIIWIVAFSKSILPGINLVTLVIWPSVRKQVVSKSRPMLWHQIWCLWSKCNECEYGNNLLLKSSSAFFLSRQGSLLHLQLLSEAVSLPSGLTSLFCKGCSQGGCLTALSDHRKIVISNCGSNFLTTKENG